MNFSPDDLVLRAKGVVFGFYFWTLGKGFGFVFVIVDSSTSLSLPSMLKEYHI